jgi:hypothetical protein
MFGEQDVDSGAAADASRCPSEQSVRCLSLCPTTPPPCVHDLARVEPVPLPGSEKAQRRGAADRGRETLERLPRWRGRADAPSRAQPPESSFRRDRSWQSCCHEHAAPAQPARTASRHRAHRPFFYTLGELRDAKGENDHRDGVATAWAAASPSAMASSTAITRPASRSAASRSGPNAATRAATPRSRTGWSRG